MDDPIWISKDLAMAIHRRQLAEHGGQDGIREEGLLESALARPRQMLAYTDPTPDTCALAASLAFGLSRNHPFIDGNKRTALVACETFLNLNDVELTADNTMVYPMFLSLAAGTLSEQQLADWLRANCR